MNKIIKISLIVILVTVFAIQAFAVKAKETMTARSKKQQKHAAATLGA
jgi:hypothetical protein